MALNIVDRPSPNHDARDAAIDMLVLHYTGMKTADEALARLCDPAAKVSAHYTIDRDGCVYVHVPEERRAWHAGASVWKGKSGVNACSIGVELVNPGHEFGYIPFADDQIASLTELAQGILARHAIPARRVLAHSDVAPGRKTDPGELLPWKRLAENGIGLWPGISPHLSGEVDPRNADRVGGDFTGNLARFGYGVPPAADIPLETVVAAFQRHFRPSRIDGVADAECGAILADLLAG
ncbi:MAG: N-acetylmuramoyl-L-alanine amidase [Alphaproteobacteria bacterium]|nr:N-acetylmuramoyl-L-alanine amidase [Alphaproteobacteria bacterium]MDE2629549.1 N-acetylmuramoyl-L-alanine amidase [Alphaproteobacteria bacterium]